MLLFFFIVVGVVARVVPFGVYTFSYFFCSGLFFSLSFSFIRLLFFVALVLVFFMTMGFCLYYMGQYDRVYYHFLMLLFGCSMVILIFHSSLFSLMVGWDGLGLSSYLLVCYYNRWVSVNSAFVTVLSNRVGDVLLLWFVYQVLFIRSVGVSFLFLGYSFLVLFFAGATKSAQFPFSSWLPQAMAAPTPTRALVHSSTLVTAGIYLFIKYGVGGVRSFIFMLFFVLGLVTVFVSGFVSMVETDRKKIIALSTLNQLGFIVIMLSLGNKGLVFLHLVTHALFKSCIFLQIGFFIHRRFSNQDFRVFSSLSVLRLSNSFIFVSSLLSLCGLTYLRGFVSKELVLFSLFYFSFRVFIKFSFMCVFFFTLFYSVRLVKVLRGFSSCAFFSSFSSIPLCFSFLLYLGGVVGGFWLGRRYFLYSNFFGGKEVLLVFLLFLLFFVVSYPGFLFSFRNMGVQDALYKGFTLFFNKGLLGGNSFVLFFVRSGVLSFFLLGGVNQKYKYSVNLLVFLLVFLFLF